MSIYKMLIVGDELLPPQTIKDLISLELSSDWELKTLWFGPRNLGLLDGQLGEMESTGSEAVNAPLELLEEIEDADVVLTHICPINQSVIEKAKKLKLIGVLRGGHENVNLKEATDRNIPVFNTLGRTSEAVSDFTVGLILAEIRNIARSHAKVMAGEWEKTYANSLKIPEMKDLTIGLVGFGEIGKLVYQKLTGFRSKVIVYDPYTNKDYFKENNIEHVDLNTLLKTSNVVSLHARHMVGDPPVITKQEIDLLREDCYFINTARAGLIDMNALVEALKQNKISGAALDVFEEEPLQADNELLNLNNVTLTSHIAFDTQNFYQKSPQIWYRGVKECLDNQKIKSCLNYNKITKDQLLLVSTMFK